MVDGREPEERCAEEAAQGAQPTCFWMPPNTPMANINAFNETVRAPNQRWHCCLLPGCLLRRQPAAHGRRLGGRGHPLLRTLAGGCGCLPLLHCCPCLRLVPSPAPPSSRVHQVEMIDIFFNRASEPFLTPLEELAPSLAWQVGGKPAAPAPAPMTP